MIYPLVPLFLTRVLGAPMVIVGVIEGAAEATASVLKGVSGWVSDRAGVRRPLVIFGYSLAAVTKPLLALAAGWPLVLTARVLDRFGKGVRGTPRDALIADSSEPALRGRAFGFHRSTDQIGAVIGPLAALPLLAAFQDNYRALFVTAFVPAALGVAVLLAVREAGKRRPAGVPPPRIGLRGMNPALRGFVLVMLVFTLGNSSDMFLILRARQLGLGDREVVLLYACFNLLYVLSAYPAGIVSDRVGRRNVLAAGLGVFALVYLGFGVVNAAAWAWPLMAVYGLYMGLTDGTTRAIVVDLAGPEQRATALGLFSMVTGLATFAASAIAGVLWQTLGPPAPFYYGASLAAVTATLVLAGRSPTVAAQ